MSILLNENGQPIILLQEQETIKRLKGIEAHKANILMARGVATTIRTSLGPRGMDKIIVDPDGGITITNDGATMLSKMEIGDQCGKLLVELSKSQDDQMGDGTTGAVVLAGALLGEAAKLMDRGLHPLIIADGYDSSADIAIKHLEEQCTTVANTHEQLVQAAMVSLSSKVVSNCARHLAEIAVAAVTSVMDKERKDVNFDLIKIITRPGGRIEDSALINGVVLDKNMSHSQMPKDVRDAKICCLTAAFEPPKPKTKHRLDIKTPEAYEKLQELEKNYFLDMIKSVKDSGANFVVCQWGFDDEANHLLMANNLPAIRWVGGVDLELLAIATGAQIIPRFEDITPSKLGRCGKIREIQIGTDNSTMVILEECPSSKAITMILRGANSMLVNEVERSMRDAMCSVRNLIRDSRVVPGGGAAEVAAALAVDAAAAEAIQASQFAMKSFANALLSIPETLAENSGMDPLEVVATLKSCHANNKSGMGVDGIAMQVADMYENSIIEPLAAKTHQISLATQAVRMILKIDDSFEPDQYE